MQTKTLSIMLFFLMLQLQAQTISGTLRSSGVPLPYAHVQIQDTRLATQTDTEGNFILPLNNIPQTIKKLSLQAHYVGYESQTVSIVWDGQQDIRQDFDLIPDPSLDEIVISATLKPVLKSDSAVPVEVYTAAFFQKNPTANLFDAVKMINGVQPQLNCNVCNTGDIHINGMEGPYTLILIDGMPIVSSLASVYGLSGIPTAIIDRIEVVKGPASSLYGSEAMGGLINVITKNPSQAPVVSFDAFTTSWLETNVDAATAFKVGKKLTGLLGLNYFKFGEREDQNQDGFTDVTLQDRVAIFNKWNLDRPENRVASLALRYLYEDRWGGELHWNRKKDRGGTEVYGESIWTNRIEAIGLYQLPTRERIMTQFSYNWHAQNSFYGPESYQAKQQILFGQVYWDKIIQNHSFLIGSSFKYTYYDDNTRGTGLYDEEGLVKNQPMHTPLPGIFIQDEWKLNSKHTVLMGYRFDYDSKHKEIHSPRLAYKYTPAQHHTLRASLGTGFRVVNVFTEDHRALSGAREVVFNPNLNPEKSYNTNLNYVVKWPTDAGVFQMDLTGFYTYFTNKIDADTDTDQTQIRYDNLDGYAISQGVSLNLEARFDFPLRLMLGATLMDVYRKEEGEKMPVYHAPKWSGIVLVSYDFGRGWSTDLTADWNGPMRMPRVENDYRSEYAPWVAIANLQITKKISNEIQLYAGVKNLLNTLPKGDAIARWWDPYGTPGNGVTPPPGRTDVIFEPNDYSYTPMQGARAFIGLRYTVN